MDGSRNSGMEVDALPDGQNSSSPVLPSSTAVSEIPVITANQMQGTDSGAITTTAATRVMSACVPQFPGSIATGTRAPLVSSVAQTPRVSNPVRVPGPVGAPRMSYHQAVQSTSGGPGARDSVMQDIDDRIVRLVFPYTQNTVFTQADIIKALNAHGVPDKDIAGAGQMQKYRIWEVMFTNTAARDKIAQLESLHTPGGAAKVFPTTGNVTYVRMYWVPFPLSNEMIGAKLIAETAKNGGQLKILSAEKLYASNVSGSGTYRLETTTRVFKVEVNDNELIPHLMDFYLGSRSKQAEILVTVTGRLPMCLKCKQIGHHRASCVHNMDDKTWCRHCQANVGHSTNECDKERQSRFARNADKSSRPDQQIAQPTAQNQQTVQSRQTVQSQQPVQK